MLLCGSPGDALRKAAIGNAAANSASVRARQNERNAQTKETGGKLRGLQANLNSSTAKQNAELKQIRGQQASSAMSERDCQARAAAFGSNRSAVNSNLERMDSKLSGSKPGLQKVPQDSGVSTAAAQDSPVSMQTRIAGMQSKTVTVRGSS
ncbi:hypothetical protein [Mangrovicoccus sp. HB161399]|uniref:hypothetical protein n=1 Tax=Mangrovicoccus sp. HB161399 TaxID=2720392 RepID=UPI001557D36D|nr:hypothetical protein [Mangrovicoccus sp. HB161399]